MEVFIYQVANTETVHEPTLIYGGPGTLKITVIKSITNDVNYVQDYVVLWIVTNGTDSFVICESTCH